MSNVAIYPDLQGQNVLITGGANGIGQAIVSAFHRQKARVFFCDTDAKAGRSLAKQLGSEAFFTKLDLRDEQQISRWTREIGERWKRIAVVVNNAASDPRIPLEKTTASDWDRLFALNLRAYFLMSRETVRYMPAGGGSIVNLASITWHIAPAEMSAYVGTKGGVLGFTRALARELGPRGIRVNAVSPGWIMTERQLRDYVTPAVKKLIRKSQCVPELLQPADIANVVLFLASHASGAITGQEILADRGWAHS